MKHHIPNILTHQGPLPILLTRLELPNNLLIVLLYHFQFSYEVLMRGVRDLPVNSSDSLLPSGIFLGYEVSRALEKYLSTLRCITGLVRKVAENALKENVHLPEEVVNRAMDEVVRHYKDVQRLVAYLKCMSKFLMSQHISLAYSHIRPYIKASHPDVALKDRENWKNILNLFAKVLESEMDNANLLFKILLRIEPLST